MKPSPAEQPPDADELLLITAIRAWGVAPDEAIRRLCAGPVVQDPETFAWKRPARPIPDGWRIISPSRN